MKQKQYYNLRQQHGHGEGGRIIHKTRNPHVISRLTGNPGNKDFNTFWMPDRVGHDMELGQSGRSMVEMLGTLAIMGALSVGAIGGYSYAMNKHRTNELIYEATKRAQWVGTQLELGSEPSLGTFGTETFGFGEFSGIDNNLPNTHQFGIMVSNLKKGVCDNLVNNLDRSGVIRDVTNVDCQAGTATLVFNRDLSTSDSEIPSVEPEVSGEVSAQASTEAPTTQDPDEVHCSGNGSWNGSSCYCDNGWQGDNCSEEEPESGEPATINNEPEETATAQSGDAECNYHGSWIASTGGEGHCDCESGWGGSDCSVNGRETYCSNQGTWNGTTCTCDSGYGGADCSQDLRAPCSNHGTWDNFFNACFCDATWGGSDCSIENGCLHGTWCGSCCQCASSWGGTNCAIANPCNDGQRWGNCSWEPAGCY